MQRLLLLCLSVFGLIGLYGAGSLRAADIRMLSTGVGIEERVPRADYSALLIFSEAKGPLLAYVSVKVTDKQGQAVVDTVSDGPWLFLGLPPGTYKVQATRKSGATKTATLTVPSKGQARLHLRW